MPMGHGTYDDEFGAVQRLFCAVAYMGMRRAGAPSSGQGDAARLSDFIPPVLAVVIYGHGVPGQRHVGGETLAGTARTDDTDVFHQKFPYG